MKCPYCGHENDNAAWKCSKCQAGFPHEKTTEEKPVKVSKRKTNKESE